MATATPPRYPVELTREQAAEAARASFAAASRLEWEANNNPEPARRRELLRRAWLAYHAACALELVGHGLAT